MRKHFNSADFGDRIREFMLFCEIENKSQKTPKDLIMPLLEENDIKCGKDFSSATEVNESFLSRIRNESSPKFDYEIVLAICVGMRAGLSRTIEILDAFGYSFRKTFKVEQYSSRWFVHIRQFTK